VASLCAFRTAAAAAVSLCGPNICYQYDDAQVGIGVFGSPTLVGDAIRFLPPVLLASTTNGGLALASASFLFDCLYAPGGAELATINVASGGDYAIAGSGSVHAALGLTIGDNPFDGTTAGDTTAFFTSDPTTAFEIWSLTAAVAPSAAFGDLARDVSLKISSDLSAFSAGFGDFAFIQQKFLISVATVGTVPEPASIILFSFGLAGVLLVDRRRRPALVTPSAAR
jgi:hypothetical protein